jgi:hypothetical protein
MFEFFVPDEFVAAAVGRYGIRTRIGDPGINDHTVAHVLRDAALHRVIALVAPDADRVVRLVDVCGAARSSRAADRINALMGPVELREVQVIINPVHAIMHADGTIDAATGTAKDFGAGRKLEPLTDDGIYEVSSLLIDVYHVTPEHIATLFEASRGCPVFLILRRFAESTPIGVDHYTVDVDGRTKSWTEGIYAVNDGMVSFSSGALNVTYRHPVNEFLFHEAETSRGVYSPDVLGAVGPYYIVRAVIIPFGRPVIRRDTHVVSEFAHFVPAVTWYNFSAWFRTRILGNTMEELLYHIPTVASLSTVFATRDAFQSAVTEHSLDTQVKRALTRSVPGWKIMSDHPMTASTAANIVVGTRLASLYAFRDERLASESYLRDVNHGADAMIAGRRKRSAFSSTPWRIPGGVQLPLLALLLLLIAMLLPVAFGAEVSQPEFHDTSIWTFVTGWFYSGVDAMVAGAASLWSGLGVSAGAVVALWNSTASATMLVRDFGEEHWNDTLGDVCGDPVSWAATRVPIRSTSAAILVAGLIGFLGAWVMLMLSRCIGVVQGLVSSGFICGLVLVAYLWGVSPRLLALGPCVIVVLVWIGLAFGPTFVVLVIALWIGYWSIPVFMAMSLYEPTAIALDDFKADYVMGLEPGVPNGVYPLPLGYTLPALAPRVEVFPPALLSEPTVWIGGEEMDLEAAWELFQNLPGRGELYPILITTGLPYRPAGGGASLLAATVCRLHKDFGIKSDYSGWERVYPTFDVVFGDFTIEKFETEEEVVLDASGARKRRLELAFEERHSGNLSRRIKNNQVHVKRDETLPFKASGDFIPRCITAPPDFHQLDAQPAIRAAYALLKEVWFWPYVHEDVTFWVTLGFGLTAERLDEFWSQAAQADGWVLLQSGDDSVFRTPDGAWYEGDYTKFDQSQGSAALEAEWRVLRLIGVPNEIVEGLVARSEAPYVALDPTDDVRIKGRTRVQRKTGAADTTFGNTLTGVGALLQALIDDGIDDLTYRMERDFGFLFKLVPADLGMSPVFLRGWWVPASDGSMLWMPLPSIVNKAGKMTSDPRRSMRKGEWSEALARAAHAMFHNLGEVPSTYPVVGAFRQAVMTLADPMANMSLASESYRPIRSRPVDIDRTEALMMVAARYGVAVSEVEAAEELLREVQVPSLVAHPLFWRMRAVDYGH